MCLYYSFVESSGNMAQKESETAAKPRMLRVDRIAGQLRERLAEGVYPPDTLLPPERELARELGVSRTTVSAALSSLVKERLVEQTRGRGTRALTAQERLSCLSIGVLHGFNMPSRYPEPAFIMRGILDSLTQLGYGHKTVPIVAQDYPHSGLSENLVRISSMRSLTSRYDALICVEDMHAEDQLLMLEERRIPLVVANLETDLPVTATYVDHRKVMRSAVEVLAALGHRRIAYVGTETSQFFYKEALEGYLGGLEAVGLTRDESLIGLCEQTAAIKAYMATRSLLATPNPPTAIVAARDLLANGVQEAAVEAGLEVGRDISIIGFDDLEQEAHSRSLTTFHEPAYEMGRVAAEMLVDRIVNGWRPPEKRELEAPLVLRRSVGPAPHASAAGNSAPGKGGEMLLKRISNH